MPRRVAQAWIREASDQSRMNVQDGTVMADAQYALGAFYYAGLWYRRIISGHICGSVSPSRTGPRRTKAPMTD